MGDGRRLLVVGDVLLQDVGILTLHSALEVVALRVGLAVLVEIEEHEAGDDRNGQRDQQRDVLVLLLLVLLRFLLLARVICIRLLLLVACLLLVTRVRGSRTHLLDDRRGNGDGFLFVHRGDDGGFGRLVLTLPLLLHGRLLLLVVRLRIFLLLLSQIFGRGRLWLVAVGADLVRFEVDFATVGAFHHVASYFDTTTGAHGRFVAHLMATLGTFDNHRCKLFRIM